MCDIVSALKYLSVIRQAFSSLAFINRHINRLSSTYDIGEVKEISDLFFNRQINLGEYVCGKAYLSAYAHSHIPGGYTQFCISPGNVTGIRTQFEVIPNPIPIQTLPNIGELRQFKIGFLYPTDFSGFDYPVRPDEVRPKIFVPDSSKPIPIILNFEQFGECLESFVKFKVKLSELPSEYIDSLFAELGIYAEEVFGLAYHPNNFQRKTLCLTALDDRADIQSQPDAKLGSMPCNLHLEAHLDDFSYCENLEPLLFTSIPELHEIQRALILGDTTARYFLTTGKVVVSFRPPNVFSFFIKTDLANPNSYEENFRLLQAYYRQTSKNIQNNFVNAGHPRYKLKLDFLYDYAVASSFHPDGVLVSKEANKAICGYPNFAITRNWLRGHM